MPRSVNINVPQPTWNSGFARSAGESAHPEKWKGLIAACVPGLGNTGITRIPDVSPRRRNSVWTMNGSMTAADWVPSDGRLSLDPDGSDDFLSHSPVTFTDPNVFSFMVWLFADTDSLSRRTILGHNNQVTRWQYEYIRRSSLSTSTLQIIISGTFVFRAEANVDWTDPVRWRQIAFTSSGSGTGTRALYLDGVPQTISSDVGTSFTNPTVNTEIGRRASGSQLVPHKFDEVLFYDRHIPEAEMKEFVQLGRGGIFQLKPITIGKQRAAVVGGFIPMRRKRIRYEILHNRG